MNWLNVLKSIANAVLGLFGYSKAPESTGEDIGEARAAAQNAAKAATEVEGATNVEAAEAAALVDDLDRLHDPADPAARPYKPGSAD